ncbi:MAG: flagellar FliJ family protein [Oscillospiraceae bacterium]|nr:flagellar FliJ family protein [Oscillospiraceae bacterium]
MKRFRFQLEPVLDFKQQALESLMVELDMIQGRVMAQEFRRNEAFQKVEEYNTECARRKAEGMTVVEAMQCETCEQVLARRAQEEDAKLRDLQKQEEAKRSEVVEARKETHSLEKLREVRRNEYDKALAKEEEKALDDLTAARRAVAG